MATRIFRFYGRAYSLTDSVSVTATFNGEQVHLGPVPTVNQVSPNQKSLADPGPLMFEYIGSTELSGNIPLELLVTGGELFFGTIHANYSGYEDNIDRTDPDAPIVTIITPPENFWGEINQKSLGYDGKINVKINGVDQFQTPSGPEEIGNWYYCIQENKRFTCDIFVDPATTVTEVPE